LKENKNINQSSLEEEDDLDLQEGDPNTFLQDDVMINQGPGDPEFKGSAECLSRENKHIFLEAEDDALIECTIQ